MNLLDVVILLAAASAGYGGYKLGLVARAASWVGMLVGLFLAARLLPWVLRHFDETNQGRLLITATCFLLLGSFLGQIGGLLLGQYLTREMPRRGRARNMDRFGGSIAGILGVFVALWVLLPALASGPEWTARQARTSAIAGAIDDVFPDPPRTLEVLRRLVGANNLPQVLDGLEAAPDLGDPPSALAIPEDVAARVARSVVLVEGAACRLVQSGTGFVVGDGLVVTNAHVVAGEDATVVERDDGRRLEARVLAYDPDRDVAFLEVPGLDRPALVLDRADVGETVAAFGHPQGGPLRVAPAEVARIASAIGRDIYDRGVSERLVLFLAARLQPGDSGAPVVRADGTVVGVAFAIAPDRDDVAYALDISEVEAVAATLSPDPVDTGACIS